MHPGDDAADSELVVALEKIANLEQALVNARLIGAAVGIIMVTEHVTYDDAFRELSSVSQNQSRKLLGVAEEVLFTGVLERKPSSASAAIPQGATKPRKRSDHDKGAAHDATG